MKYRAGDLVRIREDIKEGDTFGEDKAFITYFMSKFAGKIVEIDFIYNNSRYVMKEVTGFWIDSMLEGEVFTKTIKLQDFKVGKIYTHHNEKKFILDHSGKFFSKLADKPSNKYTPAIITQEMLDWEFVEVEVSFIDSLKKGDGYFGYNSVGEIVMFVYRGDRLDRYNIKIGNVFKTSMDAKEHTFRVVKIEEENNE